MADDSPLVQPHRSPLFDMLQQQWNFIEAQSRPAEPMDFLAWLEEKIRAGLTVDGKPFTWKGYEPLKTVYAAIGEQQDNIDKRHVVLRKSSQMGATIMELLSILWRAESHPGVSLGFYFPTWTDVSELSKLRLRPIAAQIVDFTEKLPTGGKATNTIGAFVVGGSPIYMRYMKGKVSKDSIPLDGITFDEVRLMEDVDVDQALERVDGSAFRWKLMCSTAGFPDTDIDRWYQQGTMTEWLTTCKGCSHEFNMATSWPKCVATQQMGDDFRAWYICESCQNPIDPHNGRWVDQHPDRDIQSYHLHKMLAKHHTAKSMWGKWVRTRNKAQFYKGDLGRPYVDKEQVPLSQDFLRKNSIDRELRWIKGPLTSGDSYLGCDQRGGENHVVIVGPHPSRPGGFAQRHVEIIQDDNPWIRLGELFNIYDVDVGVLDGLPNQNEAIRFAKEFAGRAFVAYYDETLKKTGDLVLWGDKPRENVAVRKSDREVKFEYTARIYRYLALGWATDAWVQRRLLTPHPNDLEQDVMFQGRSFRMSPVDSHHKQLEGLTQFKHLSAVASQIEKDPDTGSIKKARWVNMGLDPHFLHATGYALVAASRRGARPTIHFPGQPIEGVPEVADTKDLAKELLAQGLPMQGGSMALFAAAEDAKIERFTCAECREWKKPNVGPVGTCQARGIGAKADLVSCEWFDPIERE